MFDEVFTGSDRVCPYCDRPVDGVAVGVYNMHAECVVSFERDLVEFDMGLTAGWRVPQVVAAGVVVTPASCAIEGNSPSEVF